MSALGHKRTFCFVRVMSAFTPRKRTFGDANKRLLRAKSGHDRMLACCPLYLQLQTLHQHDAAFAIANVGSNWAPRPALRRIRTDHKNPDIKL
jgi:hypothetical protein